MILYFDENLGSRVPEALAAAGLDVRWCAGEGWLGASDVQWLSDVGAEGWLAVSHDMSLLVKTPEHQAIFDHNVGIVFLTQQTTVDEKTSLLRAQVRALEWLDAQTPRPFVRFLLPDGSITAAYRGRRL